MSVVDGAGRAHDRAACAGSNRRAASDRAGDRIVSTLIREAIRPAQGLGPNGASADFLSLHDPKAAVVVHGGVGDGRNAYRAGPDGLSIGRGRKSKEKGRARQSKSVRTLHVFTYKVCQL